MHDACNVVIVERKEGKEISGDAFGEVSAQAIILERIPYVTAYVGLGDFGVALGFGAFPALCHIINECSSLDVSE